MAGLGTLVFGIYAMVIIFGVVFFFTRMIPGMAAAFFLGRYNGLVILPKYVLEGRWGKKPNYWDFCRFYGGYWTAAAVLWDIAALALSVFLGCLNGWLILYVRRGKVLGGLLAAVCFALGRAYSFKKYKEGR